MPIVSKDVDISIVEINNDEFASYKFYINKCNVVLSGLTATSSADTGFYTISDVAAGYLDVTAYIRRDKVDGLCDLYNRQFHPHLSALRPRNSLFEITIGQFVRLETNPNHLAEKYAMHVGSNLLGNSKPSIMSVADIVASSTLTPSTEGTTQGRIFLHIKGRIRVSYPTINRDVQNVEFCTATFRILFQDIQIPDYSEDSGYIKQNA